MIIDWQKVEFKLNSAYRPTHTNPHCATPPTDYSLINVIGENIRFLTFDQRTINTPANLTVSSVQLSTKSRISRLKPPLACYSHSLCCFSDKKFVNDHKCHHLKYWIWAYSFNSKRNISVSNIFVDIALHDNNFLDSGVYWFNCDCYFIPILLISFICILKVF